MLNRMARGREIIAIVIIINLEWEEGGIIGVRD